MNFRMYGTAIVEGWLKGKSGSRFFASSWGGGMVGGESEAWFGGDVDGDVDGDGDGDGDGDVDGDVDVDGEEARLGGEAWFGGEVV